MALFVVGVGGSAILTTYRLAARAAVRGPNTLGEEGKLYFARHVQRGEAPFAPGTEPPFYPSFHGALVHASVGFVAWIGDLGPDGIYWTGRLISILATLALLAVFGALLRGLDVPTPLLVAALAAWLAHEELVQHAVSFRPDHWNLCLSALACGLLARGRGRPWETLLLALIPVVAFFVKAPGALLALPIAACLLLQGRRRAALGCSLGSAVIASAAMWILDATSAGRFSAGLIGGVAMPTSPWLAWLLLRDVRLWIPLLLPLFLIPWALAPDPGRRARQALLVFWSFSLPLSLLTSMRFGSNTYYFLEPYTYGLLLATAWLARELAAREGRRPGRAPALQCLVALTSLLHLSGLVGTWTAWPTDWSMAYTAKVGRDRAAVAARLNERRLSCFSDDSALNVLLDRPAVIYPTFLSLRVLAGEREAEPVLEPFERQRYDVVLLTGIERSARGVPVLAPELREAIEASYVRLDSALTYEVYVPRGLARRQVPGWLLEPEHLGGSAPTGGR